MVDKKQRPSLDGILLYFWWNVWKERNRRIFQHKSLEVAEVASLITNDINQYQNTRIAARTRATTGTLPTDQGMIFTEQFFMGLSRCLPRCFCLVGVTFLSSELVLAGAGSWSFTKSCFCFFPFCLFRVCFSLTPSNKNYGKALAIPFKKITKF
jgi:hypothetical protein